MAAGSTYTPIATQTLSSATSNITFTSISSAYTDLILIVVPKTSTGDYLRFRVGNGSIDTTSNYSQTDLVGNGSSAGSYKYSSNNLLSIQIESATPTAQFEANTILSLQNYSNSTTYKSMLWRTNKASGGVEACVGLWRSTSAINTISVFTLTYDLQIGTIATLYGIAAA
jgi:hypothetical protein